MTIGALFSGYGGLDQAVTAVTGARTTWCSEIHPDASRVIALSPRFSEWLMGLAPGWVTDVPGIRRSEQLHILGNGVVPQQAIAALQTMMGEQW